MLPNVQTDVQHNLLPEFEVREEFERAFHETKLAEASFIVSNPMPADFRIDRTSGLCQYRVRDGTRSAVFEEGLREQIGSGRCAPLMVE